VQATKDFAAAVEKSVSHYAPTVGDFLEILAGADDPGGYISALAVEEQEMFSYNRGGHSHGDLPKVTLTAVYPADGTLFADHPYVVLRAPWANDAKKKAALDFMEWLLAPGQQAQFQDAGFRNQYGEAGDALQYEAGISPGPVKFNSPPQPEVIAAIQNSWQSVRKSARILILLVLADEAQREYVKTDVRSLSSKDEVGVWALAPAKGLSKLDVTRLSDSSDEVLRAVQAAPAGIGRVPLYAAIRDAYRYLNGQADPEKINAIVVIAANLDDDSGPRLIELQREVSSARAATPVRIYAVTLKGSSQDDLLKIEKASGGVVVDSSSEGPADAIQIALANF
jgi:Ca-activated chloride channel family protein